MTLISTVHARENGHETLVILVFGSIIRLIPSILLVVTADLLLKSNHRG